MKQLLYYITALLLIASMQACGFKSEADKAHDVAEAFWQAVLMQDMEQAKQLAGWDSAQYLQFMHNDNIKFYRFELGEIKITDYQAEIATFLYTGQKADMQIPVRTVLARYQDDWRVDVKQTLGTMTQGAMGTVLNELNNFMQNGIRGLDEALNKGLNDLGKELENGLKQFQQELQKQSYPPAEKQEVI